MASVEKPIVHHPAPQRRKVHWWRQWIGLFGAPSSWAAQMNMSEILTSHACYPQVVPLSKPIWDWMGMALITINILCFATGLFSTYVGWSSWRRAQYESKGGTHHTLEVGEGRTRFLALMSAISSIIFMVAIVFSALVPVLVAPCHMRGAQ